MTAPGLQRQLPGLADEIDTERMVRLFRDELEACAPVDVARGDEDALRPQHDLAVALLTGEADALLRQRAADAEPPGFPVHQEQANLGHLVRTPDQEDRADRLAVDLGDPAMLACRIERFDELRADLGGQGFERDVPA